MEAAKKLNAIQAPLWQVGIQFFQVGDDGEAAKVLRELDDALLDLGWKRDMVDTVPNNRVDGASPERGYDPEDGAWRGASKI